MPGPPPPPPPTTLKCGDGGTPIRISFADGDRVRPIGRPPAMT